MPNVTLSVEQEDDLRRKIAAEQGLDPAKYRYSGDLTDEHLSKIGYGATASAAQVVRPPVAGTNDGKGGVVDWFFNSSIAPGYDYESKGVPTDPQAGDLGLWEALTSKEPGAFLRNPYGRKIEATAQDTVKGITTPFGLTTAALPGAAGGARMLAAPLAAKVLGAATKGAGAVLGYEGVKGTAGGLSDLLKAKSGPEAFGAVVDTALGAGMVPVGVHLLKTPLGKARTGAIDEPSATPINTSTPDSTVIHQTVESTPRTGASLQDIIQETGYNPEILAEAKRPRDYKRAAVNPRSAISPELGGQIVKRPTLAGQPIDASGLAEQLQVRTTAEPTSGVPTEANRPRPELERLAGEPWRDIEEQAGATGLDPLTMDLAKSGTPDVYKNAAEIANPPVVESGGTARIQTQKLVPAEEPGVTPKIETTEPRLQLLSEISPLNATDIGPNHITQLRKMVLEGFPREITQGEGTTTRTYSSTMSEPVAKLAEKIKQASGMKITTGSPEAGFVRPGLAYEKLIKLYRATKKGEKGFRPWSSWTKDKETAKAYTKNQGFGGPYIRSITVPLDNVLEIDTTNRAGMRKLAEDLGLDPIKGDEWFDAGYRYPWEESRAVSDLLTQSKYKYISYIDDFPAGAQTIVPIKEGLNVKLGSPEAGFLNIASIARDLVDLAKKSGTKSYTGFARFVKSNFPGLSSRFATGAWRLYGVENVVKGVTTKSPSKVLDLMRFVTARDRLERLGGDYKSVGDSAYELHEQARAVAKPYINELYEVLNKIGPDKADMAHQITLEEVNSGRSLASTITDPGVKAGYDALRSFYARTGKQAVDLGIPVYDEATRSYRIRRLNPNFAAQMIDPGAHEAFLGSTKRDLEIQERLKKDFLDHATSKGLTAKEATARLDYWINTLKAKGVSSAEFAGNRLAAGIGLPKSWVDANAHRALGRYANRFGRDVAWFNVVQKDPKLMSLWGETSDAWGRPIKPSHVSSNADIQGLKSEFLHNVDFTDPQMGTASKVANNLIIGQYTQIRNLLQLPMVALRYANSPKEAIQVAKGLMDFRRSMKKALETGNYSLEMGNARAIFDSVNGAANRVAAAATSFGKWAGGRVLGERLERSMSQGAGEIVGQLLEARAARGDKASIAELAEYNPTGAKLTPEELGARISRTWSGRYNQTDMPTWMQERGAVASAFRLMRWSGARTRYVERHVLGPALKYGDYRPLIKWIAGGVLTGEIIKQINFSVFGQRQRMPNEQELIAADSKDKKLWAYNIAQMGAASSLFGFYTDALKTAVDVGTGGRNSWFATPAFEIVRSMISNIGEAISGYQNSNDGTTVMEVTQELFHQLMKDNVQVGRLIENVYNHTNPKSREELVDKEESRDLRAWRIASGRAEAAYGGQSGNPYQDMRGKAWRKETDPDKVVESLPGLVEKLTDSAPDYETAKKRIGSLKRMSATSMPAESDELAAYAPYLERMGVDVADRYRRYLERKRLLSIKAGLVPKL